MNNLYDAQQRNLRDAKILLIEDNPDDFLIVQRVLLDCMPEVQLLLATTSDEALHLLSRYDQLRKKSPRLILLDLYLPERTTGLNLLKQIKEYTSPYRSIPVTILSHSQQTEDVQTSYDLGTNSYMVKPVNYNQWLTYFQSIRQYWWHTVTLPLL